MGKYSVNKLNIPTVHQNKEDILTEEQKHIREQKYKLLRQLGVYIALYAEGIEWPGHPDGVHNYLGDALEAQQLESFM